MSTPIDHHQYTKMPEKWRVDKYTDGWHLDYDEFYSIGPVIISCPFCSKKLKEQ